MVWMTTWSHCSWLVRIGADTVQHLRCDTDSECKCGLKGTCLYLGSLRKSLSSRSDTKCSQAQYQCTEIPKETGSFGFGYTATLGSS